jgi:hypothetical protein
LDKLGRHSVYLKDKALVADIKYLCADTDSRLIELVDIALRHFLAMANAVGSDGAPPDLHYLQAALAAAEATASAYRFAEGKRQKRPIGSSL